MSACGGISGLQPLDTAAQLGNAPYPAPNTAVLIIRPSVIVLTCYIDFMLKFDPEITIVVVFLALVAVFLALDAGLLGAIVLGFVCTWLATPIIALLHA